MTTHKGSHPDGRTVSAYGSIRLTSLSIETHKPFSRQAMNPEQLSASVRIAVVIPSWNGKRLLETCLPAILRSTVKAEVIVVDNGSNDGTSVWLGQRYPQVRVIKNPRNLGFATAVNQGIRATHTEWVALLNNDAVAEPDWLEHLLTVGDSDSRVGSVATRMMFRADSRLVSSAGIRVDRSGSAWDLFLGKSHWPITPLDVFGASGGACLYRRAMLTDVGLFDDSFFMYLEDVDLAWRSRLRGWRALLSPSAVVYHALSATLGEGSPKKRYHLARNKWRVIVRNYPWQLLIQSFALIALYDGLSIGRSLLERDGASLRGRVDAFRELPRLMQQRRKILGSQLAPWTEIRDALSPIESPLALYRRGRSASRLAGGS